MCVMVKMYPAISHLCGRNYLQQTRKTRKPFIFTSETRLTLVSLALQMSGVCVCCSYPLSPSLSHFLSSLMWFCYHANSWEFSNKNSSGLRFYSWSLYIHISICNTFFSNPSFTTVPVTCFSLLHLFSFEHLFCCYDFGGDISSNLLLKFRIFFLVTKKNSF